MYRTESVRRALGFSDEQWDALLRILSARSSDELVDVVDDLSEFDAAYLSPWLDNKASQLAMEGDG